MEESISAASHVIVLEVWQLFYSGIEGDRQPSTRIVFPNHCVRDGGSALLAWIPGLNYGYRVLLRPVHGKRASTEQHNHQGFACRFHSLQQKLLSFGKIKRSAIASGKSG